MNKEIRRKSRAGTFFILTGFACLIAALALTLFNLWDGQRAARASAEIVEELHELTGENQKQPVAAPQKKPKAQVEVDERIEVEEEIIPEMPTEQIDDYEYIGTLEIPSLGLQLPVMNEWDYDRLKISPCRYSGSYYTDDLVICAHNYQKHFSPVKWIDMNADVYFITVDNVVYHYIVSNRETLQPTSVEHMIGQDSQDFGMDEWDMTLFTCSMGGQTRCAVRCIRTE